MVELGLAVRFENFVARLFEAEGFSVEREPLIGSRQRADLIIRSDRAAAVVEIKLFRSQSIPLRAVLSGASQVELYRESMQISAGILVIGNQISAQTKDAMRARFPQVVIYDYSILISIAANHEGMLPALSDILREALVFSDETKPDLLTVDPQSDLSDAASRPDSRVGRQRPSEPVAIGCGLCEQLRTIKMGKQNAWIFEEHLEKCLRYIFDEDLTAWSSQKSTSTRISFFDLIARVNSSHDFWVAVSSHFFSRYIVFEFKNYENYIKQGQIYTTEKYLYKTALRATAIIVSRKGADKNALAAARGALREGGKLIINLTIDDVCAMLALRDKRDDHNSVMVDIVDGLLMSLER